MPMTPRTWPSMRRRRWSSAWWRGWFMAYTIPGYGICVKGAPRLSFLAGRPGQPQRVRGDGERPAHVAHEDRNGEADQTHDGAGGQHEFEAEREADIEADRPACLPGQL